MVVVPARKGRPLGGYGGRLGTWRPGLREGARSPGKAGGKMPKRSAQGGRFWPRPHRRPSCSHVAPCDAYDRCASTASTSSVEPMTTLVRWWMLVGRTSRSLAAGVPAAPTTALPPACSTIIAIGFASYISRNLPAGFVLVGG